MHITENAYSQAFLHSLRTHTSQDLHYVLHYKHRPLHHDVGLHQLRLDLRSVVDVFNNGSFQLRNVSSVGQSFSPLFSHIYAQVNSRTASLFLTSHSTSPTLSSEVDIFPLELSDVLRSG